MKKLLTVAMLTAVSLGVALAASTESKEPVKPEPHWVSGTITAWDAATKSVNVKDDSGKEMDIAGNADTKVSGTPKVGEVVKVKYKTDKDGKSWATHVFAGKEEIEKADKKHH